MSQHSSSQRSPCLRGVSSATLAVLFLALLIRGGALLVIPDALKADPDGYRRLAENLVAHGTFGPGKAPTAYRPPLYPLLLTGCIALGDHSRVAIGVLHVLLGVATVGLVWLLAHYCQAPGRGNGGAFTNDTNASKTKRAGLVAALAALLVACDPILLTQSAQVMTETLAAFLTTAGWVALTWTARRPTVSRTMLAGATLALGVLCRPTLLLWTLLAAAAIWWQARFTIKLRLAFLFSVLIVLSPWAIRNQLQFGRPIVTTTHGGYTLWLANNPEFYQWLGNGAWGSVWWADQFNAAWNQRKPRDEVQADRLAYREAWETIRRAPGTFFYAWMVRWGRFCSPLPHQVIAHETPLRRLSRYAVAFWYVVEFLLAAIGVWHLRRGETRGDRGERAAELASPPSPFPLPPSPWLWGLLLVVSLLAAHAVYWTDMRMRAPAMPLVALAAAVGVTDLVRRVRHQDV